MLVMMATRRDTALLAKISIAIRCWTGSQLGSASSLSAPDAVSTCRGWKALDSPRESRVECPTSQREAEAERCEPQDL